MSPESGATTQASLARGAELISQADGIMVAAGAGMGVDSGLPDFRGTSGLWNHYPALGRARMEFRHIAASRTFAERPQLAWGFYGHRLGLYRKTQPHAGFATLKRWVDQSPLPGAVFTSNVDGHFQRAGFAEDVVEECHGTINWLQCSVPCSTALWPADDLEPQVDEEQCLWLGDLPRCPRCGALARPNILMFDDVEWIESRQRQQADATERWLSSARRPLVVEIGAGLGIPTVRYFSQRVIKRYGGRLIRINPREAEVAFSQDVSLPLPAAIAIGELDRALTGLTFPKA